MPWRAATSTRLSRIRSSNGATRRWRSIRRVVRLSGTGPSDISKRANGRKLGPATWRGIAGPNNGPTRKARRCGCGMASATALSSAGESREWGMRSCLRRACPISSASAPIRSSTAIRDWNRSSNARSQGFRSMGRARPIRSLGTSTTRLIHRLPSGACHTTSATRAILSQASRISRPILSASRITGTNLRSLVQAHMSASHGSAGRRKRGSITAWFRLRNGSRFEPLAARSSRSSTTSGGTRKRRKHRS